MQAEQMLLTLLQIQIKFLWERNPLKTRMVNLNSCGFAPRDVIFSLFMFTVTSYDEVEEQTAAGVSDKFSSDSMFDQNIDYSLESSDIQILLPENCEVKLPRKRAVPRENADEETYSKQIDIDQSLQFPVQRLHTETSGKL